VESPKENNPFQLLIRVRYAECDAQGVVFNARYADYADLASTEYLRSLLGSYQVLLEQGLDIQVVNLTIGWRSSAKFDDVIRLETVTTKVGNSSYTVQIRIFEHKSNREIATCEVVNVMVSTKLLQKTPIPESFRHALLNAPHNQLVDMTGNISA
jgi:acyl-CoA thioester hydrolase